MSRFCVEFSEVTRGRHVGGIRSVTKKGPEEGVRDLTKRQSIVRVLWLMSKGYFIIL